MKTLVLLMGMLMSTASFSQICESIEDIQLEVVSSNTLSNKIAVHTYKLVNGSTSSTVEDTQPNKSQSPTIKYVINCFTAIEGVERCTFDKATQTFTIVANPTTDLSSVAQKFQNK